MFKEMSSPIGDDLMYSSFYLGKQLDKLGHKAATIDTDDLKEFDAVVFIEFPGLKNKYFKKLIKNKFKNIYLIISESPIVRQDNLNQENHKFFKKIFTWGDRAVDNKKYFKLNYAQKAPNDLSFNLEEKEKFCCMISGNKAIRQPNELYTERIRAIRWFEKNHPQDFDLFGIGWDRYNFNGNFLGFKLGRLNRLTFLAKLLGQHYTSWKGSVQSKNKILKKYKFSICYENCQGFDGYITEKIFDCFFAGCVPIYLGAPNITDYIPENTFINKKNFKTYEDLYSFIKNMPDDKYENYLKNIKNFISSEKFYPFTAECFAETLIKEITS